MNRVVIAILSTVLVTACAADATEEGETEWSASGERQALTFRLVASEPPTEGTNDFELVVTGERADEVDIFARAVMPAMSHGEFPIQVDPLGGGHFQLMGVELSMPGAWHIAIQADGTGEVVDWAELEIEVP
ncbi:MAG: hypothetical protein HOW73_15450 [Polyangiaceae bacterium]|nr:hypothetical protein [Polyangiaceae bacterium]